MPQTTPTTVDYAATAGRAKRTRPTILALILILHTITILTIIVSHLADPIEITRTIQTTDLLQRFAYDWDESLYIAYLSVPLSPLALYALLRQRRSWQWLVILISYLFLAFDYATQIYLINTPPMNIISMGAVTGQILYSADSFDFVRALVFVLPGLLLSWHMVWMRIRSRREAPAILPTLR